MSEFNKTLSKEVFEVHMRYQKESMDRIDASINKVFIVLDEHEKTLARNTTTVELHRQRSDILEAQHKKVMGVLEKLSSEITLVKTDLVKIEADIEPIREHVRDANKLLGAVSFIGRNKKIIIKLVVGLGTIVSTLWYAFSEIIQGWFI